MAASVLLLVGVGVGVMRYWPEEPEKVVVAQVEDILAKNGYENIQTAQDTQGIWRVVEGVLNN